VKRLLALSLLLVALAAVVPARSSAAVAFAFNGTASLPLFPCVPGGCTGTFTGTARGVLENGNSTNAPMTASFTYSENSCEIGIANGSGLIDGVPFTFAWNRTGNNIRSSGYYGPHFLRADAVFTSTPLVSPGCLPNPKPGPLTWNVEGVAWG
jgi:hypothetical protein